MANSTWPEFQVDHCTDFGRDRELRRPRPHLMRDLGGLSDWAYLMDANRTSSHDKLVRAAFEINRQRAAGEDLRCGFCGMWQRRWDMDVQLRDGVEVFQCSGCSHAAWLGLSSRLELGRVQVEVRS